MTLQISRLRISNFHIPAECKIPSFLSPAVVVKEYGLGKSNMLHAFRLVLDPDLPDPACQLGVVGHEVLVRGVLVR